MHTIDGDLWMSAFESTLGSPVPTAALRWWLRPKSVDQRRFPTMSEPTQTATQDLRSAHTAPAPALLIVHHTDGRFVGSVTPIPGRGTLTLGRDGEGFSSDAFQDARISRRHAEVINKT